MKRTELLATNGIGFSSDAQLPYGTELTVLPGANSAGRSLFVSVSNGVSRVERIELESRVHEGTRLVVMSDATQCAGMFSYVALPAERLDEESERIEAQITHDQPWPQ